LSEHGYEDFPLPEVRDRWVAEATREESNLQEEEEAVEGVRSGGVVAVGT
jgi:hypothetical protein